MHPRRRNVSARTQPIRAEGALQHKLDGFILPVPDAAGDDLRLPKEQGEGLTHISAFQLIPGRTEHPPTTDAPGIPAASAAACQTAQGGEVDVGSQWLC